MSKPREDHFEEFQGHTLLKHLILDKYLKAGRGLAHNVRSCRSHFWWSQLVDASVEKAWLIMFFCRFLSVSKGMNVRRGV